MFGSSVTGGSGTSATGVATDRPVASGAVGHLFDDLARKLPRQF